MGKMKNLLFSLPYGYRTYLIMIQQWIFPIISILLGVIAGIIGEKIVFRKLKAIVTSKSIPGGEIIFQSLHRMTFIWFVLAGCFGVVMFSQLPQETKSIFQKIITVVFLFSVTLVCARLSAAFVNLFIQRTEGVSTSLISNLARNSILILGILIILQTLGIEITPIITTLGIGGLAVGLALQETLANLFSGFFLIISKQIKTGDYVKLQSKEEGYIADITWRNTTIRELSNNIVIIPNSKLASAIFINYHLPEKRITLTMDVGVSYDSDLEQVEIITIEIAKEVMQEIASDLLTNEPYMRFHTFDDFSITFTLYMPVKEYFDQRIGKHLLVKKLHQRYKQEGIEVGSTPLLLSEQRLIHPPTYRKLH
jgi:small-conductance mechanosensitive channel